MEDGVGELGRLLEELGRAGGVPHYEALHLLEHFKELRHGEGGEGFGDGVWTGYAGLEVHAWWERGESVWCGRLVTVWRLSLWGWLLVLLLLGIVSCRSCVVFASNV